MRSERYSTEHEIKSVLKALSDKTGGGPVLWVDPETKGVYVLDSEANTIFLGVSGAGKTRRGTIPMVMSWIESNEDFCVVDTKGDIREATYFLAKKSGYDTVSINLRDIEHSVGYAPLIYPYNLYKRGDPGSQQVSSEMVDDFSHASFPHTGENDPFWIDSSRTLFNAAVNILFEYGTEDQVTISNVYRIIAEGLERFGSSTYLDQLCSMYPEKTYSLLLKNVCSAPKETLGSIKSVFFENLSFWIKNRGITEMTNTNEFEVSSLDGTKPVAIYIVMPDETDVYSSLATVIISQLTTHLIQLAHKKYSGRLPRRFNLLIEECGNLGAIPKLEHIMSAGRSRNLRTSVVLQSFSQLDDIYGKSKAETILANADTLVAYRTNNWETLEELSKKCGEREVNYGSRTSVEPLITPTQLGAMETGQCLCLIEGRTKFISWLPDYTEVFDMGEWTPAPIEKHERNTKENIFDIKGMVKELHKEKLKKMIEEEIEKLEEDTKTEDNRIVIPNDKKEDDSDHKPWFMFDTPPKPDPEDVIAYMTREDEEEEAFDVLDYLDEDEDDDE